jgi:hypothetical protein
MFKRIFSVAVTCVSFAIAAPGCTLNVDDPEVDQSPDDEAEVDDDGAVDEACVTKCDESQTTCVGTCDDDGCRASCETKYDECVTKCE